MDLLPPDGLAVVIGGTGGIGAAFVAALHADRGFAATIALGRRTTPPLELTDEPTIAAAAAHVSARVSAQNADLRLVIVATGFLHGAGMMPQKSLAALQPAQLAHEFAINATGPALLMKHFLPLLPKAGRSIFAVLSAKVGSIGDNAAGGWYGYRAAKAALNQFLHTAAIETRRRAPDAICVALHPGTVATPLAAPFAKSGLTVRAPAVAAAEMLAVLAGLTPADSGGFFSYTGAALPW